MKTFMKVLNSIEENICAICLLIMLALLSYQVGARFLGNSNSWSEEVSRYLFIWMIFMGASYAAQKHSHIIIETAVLIWPKKIRPFMCITGILIWILFSACIVVWGIKYCQTLWMSKRISLSIFINMAIPYAAIPIGYSFLIFRLIQCELIPRTRKILKGEDSEVSLQNQILAGSGTNIQSEKEGE